MYTVTTTDSLSFVFEGAEQVLAFRAKIKIYRTDIKSINWYEKFNDWPSLQVRMPGSYLPSWIMAGSYYSEEGWDFVFAKKPKGLIQPLLFDVIVIETNKDKYRRVVLRMSQNDAEEIIKWWREH
jgi:hypothetical protein